MPTDDALSIVHVQDILAYWHIFVTLPKGC